MEAAFVPGLRFLAGQVPRRCPIPLQPSLSRTHMRSQPRFQRETLATFKLNGKSDSLLNVRFPYTQCLSPSLLKPTTLYMLRPQLWQASHSKWRPPGYLSLFSSCAPFPPRFLPSLLLPFYFASPLSSVLEALPSTHPLLCRVGCFCWYRCFHLGWFFFFFFFIAPAVNFVNLPIWWQGFHWRASPTLSFFSLIFLFSLLYLCICTLAVILILHAHIGPLMQILGCIGHVYAF